jgi:hypothetical protein
MRQGVPDLNAPSLSRGISGLSSKPPGGFVLARIFLQASDETSRGASTNRRRMQEEYEKCGLAPRRLVGTQFRPARRRGWLGERRRRPDGESQEQAQAGQPAPGRTARCLPRLPQANVPAATLWSAGSMNIGSEAGGLASWSNQHKGQEVARMVGVVRDLNLRQSLTPE